MACKLLQNDQAQLRTFCDTADRLEATAMRRYKFPLGAAASLLQNLTVLCNYTTSRRLTGTSCHKTCVLTVERTPKMCFKVWRCC